MSTTRNYNSPLREAQANATREAILDAFIEQLIEPGRTQLSPKEAAASAGCSVRTVHSHFPTDESRVAALAERIEADLWPGGRPMPSSADDLPDHFRGVHERALNDQLAAALLAQHTQAWRDVRAQRRHERLEAVRACVKAIGAPTQATDDTTAMLLALSGGEVSVSMRDDYGIPAARIPDIIAAAIETLLADLRTHVE